MIVQEHVDYIYEIIDRKAETIEEKMELFMNPIWRVGNQYYCIDGETVQAIVEKVHSMPGQGVSSSFKFGMEFCKPLMTFSGLSIPYTLVTPQKWMKTLELGKSTSYKSKTEWKNHLLIVASRIFPDAIEEHKNKTEKLKVCDALLMLEYARRIYNNGISV